MKKTKIKLPSSIGKLSKSLKGFYKDPKKKKILFILLGVFIIILVLILNINLLVAALVNNRPIFRTQLIKELEKQGGQQVLDSLITETLIKQEAAKNKIVITEADIEAELKKIDDTLKKQGTTLDDALTLQGQKKDDLKRNLSVKLIIEKLLNDKISISDEEVRKEYDANKSSYPKDSKFDDLKEEIRENLKSQKLSQEYQKWITDIKAKAKLLYLLKFN